jgi:hypothetical protein
MSLWKGMGRRLEELMHHLNKLEAVAQVILQALRRMREKK